MKKVDIIEEMEAALMRYETIKPEEFNYQDFVTEVNFDGCGTICCLWGWEPKFGILPVKWKWTINLRRSVTVDNQPTDVLGWGASILELLYYPEKYFMINNPLTALIVSPEEDATLSEVLDHWRSVINLLKTTNELDHLLNLD